MKAHNIWFKKRSHVWQPVSWQGWVTVVVFFATVVGNASIMVSQPYSNELLWLYLNTLAFAVISLLIIGYYKGPKE
ncbi:MAG: hypothetical protein KA604_01900 [Candidatus Saccharimonas sp.]|jgi:hypothetical protein|nr:hypothetical protein [Candidatus Saccharimonas sp.]